MRNHHRNSLDSLGTKGNRLVVTKQVLIAILRVVRLPGTRASFFMTLPALGRAAKIGGRVGNLVGNPARAA